MRKILASFLMHVTQLTAFALFCCVVAVSAEEAPAPPLQFAELGTCRLMSGSMIQQCKLGYRTWGTLNTENSNAILVPTWFTGHSSDIATFIGKDKMLDPAMYFIIAVDAFGNGVSSSPSNSRAQHGAAFPVFIIQDMVNAEYRLVTEVLGIRHLHAVIGQSMGGMQTFEWAMDYPTAMSKAVPIVGSPKLTSYDLLLWNSEAMTIETDPAFMHGNYAQPPALGLVELIQQLNITTPAHFANAFSASDFADWKRKQLHDGIRPNDANDWLAQVHAMLRHNVFHNNGEQPTSIVVKPSMLIITATQDHMVNPGPALAFAKQFGEPTLVLDSDCGHLSPGCESEKMFKAIREFLAQP